MPKPHQQSFRNFHPVQQKRLFFHSRREDDWAVWQVRLDGSGLERITPAGTDAYTPRAAADGRHLVLAAGREGRRQIERLDLDTRRLTPIASRRTRGTLC